MNHVKSYHKGHPNPQKYRSDYTVLNGEWDFCFDENDEGLLAHYEINFPKGLKINVPYPYQSEKSGINLPDKQCDVIWYQTTVNIENLDKENIIHFGAVDYLTTVFVNGKYVMCHEGGYDGFSVSLNDYVKVGENKLTLRVEDTMAIDQVRGKQRWRKDSFTCFYTETSGIVKDVYLERLSKKHIGDFTLKADYLKKSLTVTADCPVGTNFSITLTDNCDQIVAKKVFNVQNETADYVVELDEVNPWSDKTPYLYNVTLSLVCGGKKTDEVLSYCGFTTVELRKNKVYINDKETYLKFVLNQGYFSDTITTPTEDEIVKDIELTLECGFNGARMHEHVPSPLNFYYMDLLGHYAWQECPSAHGYSYKAQKQYFKQFPKLIKEHFSHPSIIAYVLWNESWGVNEIRESEEIRQMTVEMYNLVKAFSNGRLVISNDGWEHTVSDVVTFHNYAEAYDYLHEFLDPNLEKMYGGENTECIRNYKKFFAGDYRYAGQAVMYSEFAGIAFVKDTDKRAWGYGKGVSCEEDFLKKYEGQLNFIYDHKEFCGFCMTQLTDVYQEVNGLLTMDRQAKMSLKELKKLHDKF